MAEYASEKGVKVQTVAGDPPAPFEGQVWYNSSTGSHRVNKGALVSAWATAGSMNTGRYGLGAAGTATSAIAFTGAFPVSGATETYNGTNWTEVNDMSTGRFGVASAGSGTQTSTICFGGETPAGAQALTESWNGTNWTEVNDMNSGREQLGGSGSSNTAALAFGGRTSPPNVTRAFTESWNGTNWTEVNDLNTARISLSGAGTETAALAVSGWAPGAVGSTESWNGTNWTEVNDLGTARYDGALSGNYTEALFYGGNSDQTVTESWNGTNWTEIADLSTGRTLFAGVGTSNISALTAGGQNNPPTSEELTQSGGNQSVASS